jgi:predicted Ser/Thr protein kinase
VALDCLLDRLTEPEKAFVTGRLTAFAGLWHEKLIAVQIRDLPPHGGPVRAALLIGLVRIDIEKRWQRGQKVLVEAYLKNWPELGDADTVHLSVVLAEVAARRATGATVDLQELYGRFPKRAEELRQKLERTMVAGAGDTAGIAARATERSGPPAIVHLPEQFGRYRVLRLLGRGAMGAVYLAQDTQLHRHVALKVPHFGTGGPERRERFFREARSAAALSHPNLCPVYDAGEIDGTLFLTMGFVEGKPLAEATARGPLPLRQAALLARKLALALAEAHAQGVVHRDLKPANVMLNLRGEPVVMDFGLARIIEPNAERLTQEGDLLGTPAYMAPEQVNGDVQAQGPLTDVYSLGAVLYEMVSGQAPFSGPLARVLVQVVTAEPRAPSLLRQHVGPVLEAIIRKAMAKRSQDRFASMTDFAAALAGYLKQPASDLEDGSEEAQTVAQSAAPAKQGLRGRRGGTWLGLAALAALVLGGAGALTAWLVTRSKEPVVEAQEEPPAKAPEVPPARKEPKKTALAKPPKLPAGWIRFEPPEGRFSIGLPGQPTKTEDVVTFGKHRSTRQVFATADAQGRSYLVAYVDSPDVFPETNLDWLFAHFVKSTLAGYPNSKLRNQKRITLGEHKGLEIDIVGGPKTQPIRLVMRVYLVGNRIYQMMVGTPQEAFRREDVGPFLRSFQVVP